MAKKKTYGVSGLMEWHAVIPAGKAQVHIHFSGGALTGYGVTPAEYSTANPVIQRVIENSSYFRSGKIAILREVEVMERPMAVVGAAEIPQPTGPLATGGGPAAVSPSTQQEGADQAQDEDGLAAEDDGRMDGAVVSVSDLDEAREYLMEKYKISGSALKSKKSILETAQNIGVTFEGL